MSNVVNKMHSIQQEIPLSKTTKFIVDNRGRTSPTEKAGIPLIATNCISNNNLYPVYENLRYISQETYDNWFRSHPEPGDLLLTLKGSQNGAVCLVPDPFNFVIAQDMVALRVDEKIIDPMFLFAALRTDEVQAQIKNLDVSGVIPHLKKSDFDKLMLPYPERDAQRSIGQFYFYTSKKIDLLHRQNKTLEAMAETLFRQWFVEEAEDCKKGIINDLVEFNPARKLTKGEIAPYLEMAALSTDTFNPDGWYPREFSSGTKFINGDTLLARITPCLENGKTAYITFLDDGQVAWGSTEYIVMRPKGNFHPFFAYSLARNSDFRDYAEGCLAGSSGRQRVDIDHLKNYKISIPSTTRICEYNAFAESITPKLHSNFLQIQTLETLRDTLLPKLMSGEVRIEH